LEDVRLADFGLFEGGLGDECEESCVLFVAEDFRFLGFGLFEDGLVGDLRPILPWAANFRLTRFGLIGDLGDDPVTFTDSFSPSMVMPGIPESSETEKASGGGELAGGGGAGVLTLPGGGVAWGPVFGGRSRSSSLLSSKRFGTKWRWAGKELWFLVEVRPPAEWGGFRSRPPGMELFILREGRAGDGLGEINFLLARLGDSSLLKSKSGARARPARPGIEPPNFRFVRAGALWGALIVVGIGFFDRMGEFGRFVELAFFLCGDRGLGP
jgi:hypothetical protein